MSDRTIIYYTNNILDEPIFTFCQKHLEKTAEDIPIIAVSQKPIYLKNNIVLEGIGSSWVSLYKQLLAGCEAATTKYIATAEHDCLYTKEHFNWTPPTDDIFYYNENVYFVQWLGNHPELEGMYSTYWTERRALSQLICNRELMIKSLKTRMELLETGEIKRMSCAEPGCSTISLERARAFAKCTKGVSLAPYLKNYIEEEKSAVWRNEHPNLDIRHNKNFTGPKRGKNRTYDLYPWGVFKDIMK